MELKLDYENTPPPQQQKQQQEEEGDHEKLEKHQQQKQKQKQKHVFHVLAVDDSLIDRKLLERLLRVSSYKVTCVDSGDKALEYLGLLDNVENNSTTSAVSVSASAFSSSHSSQQEGLRVNLIVTDFCMPGMSGYDLLKKVKGSSWKDVPVVIMSSENVPARISMCLEGGAEEFLLKPLQLSDLDKLETHLLKSQNQNMDNNDFNGGNNEYRNNESNGNNNNNNNEINNFKSNNGAFSKRKALTDDTQERRPKMKELAVV